MDLNDRLDEVMNQSSSKFNIIKDNVSLNIFLFLYFLDKFNWKTNRRRKRKSREFFR